MALTGIVGRVHASLFLAQHTAFLDSHLFRDTVIVGTTTLVLTFLVLFSGFHRAFFHGLFLGIGIHYDFFNVFKNNHELPNTCGEHFLVEIILVLPRLRTHAKES
jgi:hypothetical protein